MFRSIIASTLQAAGLASVSTGVWIEWGTGPGLIASGCSLLLVGVAQGVPRRTVA